MYAHTWQGNRNVPLNTFIKVVLERADAEDNNNLCGKNGVQFVSTPLFRRKRGRREDISVMDLVGHNVQASRQKKGRK